jgi:light-regulated signal transduction histidine kinase (bacteriophytochrome)
VGDLVVVVAGRHQFQDRAFAGGEGAEDSGGVVAVGAGEEVGDTLRPDDHRSPVVCRETELRDLMTMTSHDAIKYTVPGSAARVGVSGRRDGDGVHLEIADRGIGIPQADRPHVFDAFHRSSNSLGYQGAGLGLAICRRVVERHGGRITVTGNAGGGSRFRFTLPA